MGKRHERTMQLENVEGERKRKKQEAREEWGCYGRGNQRETEGETGVRRARQRGKKRERGERGEKRRVIGRAGGRARRKGNKVRDGNGVKRAREVREVE